MADRGASTERWQALFQRAGEAVFLLSRQRRLLFVNAAWEKLTGVAAAQARGLLCGRRRGETEDGLDALAAVLCPPEEVLVGQSSQVRRRGPSGSTTRPLWDIDFVPLSDEQGLLCVLGKITSRPADEVIGGTILPEGLLDLHARVNRRYCLESLSSRLPAVRRVVDQVRLAARTVTPVLIVGEAGTGKHWVARTIHAQDSREGAFAVVDAAGLPPSVLGDLLLREEGLLRRPGVGTVYLREPGRLPREVQTALVHRLEEAREKGSEARLVGGVSENPAALVRAGLLVEEFHCALSPLVIQVFPLRERREDLPELIDRLLARLHEGDGRSVAGLTPAAWDMVRTYHWPGNLRELYNVLAVARAHAQGVSIDRADFPANIRLAVSMEGTPATESGRPVPLDAFLERAEKRLIMLALRKARGNKRRAAELLGVWRPRLLRRIEALGLGDPEAAAVEVEEILNEGEA